MSKTNQPLRIGVLGCSSIARRAIIPVIIGSLTDKFELIGIASREPAKANACADSLGIKAFGSYEALLEYDQIDAVYIPLPNSLHAEWVEKSLERGLHVLVEKSLACTVNDVELLCDKARSNQLALVENFQFRFHRQLTQIHKMLNEGEIGELRSISASFGFPPFPDDDNIRYQRELGGGALLDAGAYPIKIVQQFMGEDIRVSAAKWHIDQDKQVDTWGGGFIEQKKGDLFAEIAFGFEHFYQCNIELWGSCGKLTATRVFTAPADFSPELILENREGKRVIKVEADNHYANMLCHFYQLTQDESLAENEYRQNILQAHLIEQFRRLTHV